MHAIAKTKYLRMSPKKVRQVADLIKGKKVLDALNILNFTPKAAAEPLAKTLKSAASNAIANEGTSRLKAEDLSIKKIFVDSAPTMKRIRFQSMGRIFRIRKRMCHITIEVEGNPEPETVTRTRKRAKKSKAASDKKSSAGTKSKKTKKTSKAKTAKKKVAEPKAEKKTGTKAKKTTAKDKDNIKDKKAKAAPKAKAKPADEAAGESAPKKAAEKSSEDKEQKE